jgi:exopolysaccharide production protein ExoQ
VHRGQSTLVSVFATINPVWCAFVASVTLILLGNFSGTIGAYGFLAIWILLAATRVTTSAYAITLSWQIWLFPSFALLSVLWSQAHLVTLRFALEYLATAACAILAARLLSPRQLISALLVCLLMISVLCLAIGKTTFNEMTETVDFVGVFESKNELAFFVSLMLLAAVAVLLDQGQRWPIRALALVSLLPVLPLMVKTHSATSKLTAVVSVAMLLGNYTIAQLKSRERARIIGVVIVMISPLLALVGMAGGIAQDFVVHVLGRSSTMTGRTVLWDHAMHLIPQHALLGWGWQAFWLQNTVDAEGLWSEFHITSRQGFQFQNTFLEAAIELGWIGCALLGVLLMITTWRLVRWSWQDRSMASSFYLALIVCFLIRSVVEVDILYQFTIGSFMFFVVMCFGFDRGAASRRPAVNLRGAPAAADHGAVT